MIGVDVADLVGECLDRLGWVHVVADPHQSLRERGVPIGASARPSFDPIAVGLGQTSEAFPQVVRCRADEEFRGNLW
ncbi:hypothetical protein DDP54_16125 (plasmid) [Cellulomonas sp. WB94]|nr:hypothetical protein DDP54_16125 [Cellulomonas sp. WB94]